MATTRLLVSIDANSAKLVSEVARSRKSIEGMKTSVDSMRSSLSLIKIDSLVNLGRQALSTAQQIYNFAKGIAYSADEIVDMSRTLGMSITEFQKWNYVMKSNDVDTGTFTTAVRVLVGNMQEAKKGTGEAANAFRAMGISVDDSSGNLKSIDSMLTELIEKFGSYENGTNKIALANAVFGRNAMAMLEVLDLEKDKLEALKKMADSLGLTQADLIKQAAESKKSFQNLGIAFDALKMRLAPVVELFAKFLDLVGKFIAAPFEQKFDYFKDFGFSPEQIAAQRLKEQVGEARYVGRIPTVPEKPSAPAIGAGSDKGLERLRITISDFQQHIISAREEVYGLNEALGYTNDQNEMLINSSRKLNMEISADQKALISSTEDAIDYGDALTWASDKNEKFITSLREAEKIISDEQKALISSTEDIIDYGDAIDFVNKKNIEFFDGLQKTTDTTNQVFIQMGERWADSWAQNFTAMMRGTQDFATTVKNAFADMGAYVISVITKMIANYILFESIAGQTSEMKGWGTKGQTGWGGILGTIGSIVSLLGEGGVTGPLISHYPIRTYQEGGIANTPQIGIFGEGGGGEAFVPLRGGKIPVEGGEKATNHITAFYIYANDPISFRDFVRRNPEAIIEVMNTDSRAAGATRGIIRNVG